MKKKEESEKKPIRFFCDKCGFEVPQDAKICPDCGRSFLSVKCPACGFIGQAALFGDGCPMCGYSKDKTADTAPSPPAHGFQPMYGAEGIPPGADDSNGTKKARRPMPYRDLPLWIYIITGIALLISCFALYVNLR
ncbi:MAG: zinc ribbon domain-containing protein [Treponema sp.]|jgi:hypothetical protein|nr:zinc ribbon domain-containing protein [Treponema sp.]